MHRYGISKIYEPLLTRHITPLFSHVLAAAGRVALPVRPKQPEKHAIFESRVSLLRNYKELGETHRSAIIILGSALLANNHERVVGVGAHEGNTLTHDQHHNNHVMHMRKDTDATLISFGSNPRSLTDNRHQAMGLATHFVLLSFRCALHMQTGEVNNTTSDLAEEDDTGTQKTM